MSLVLAGWTHDSMPCSARHPPRLRLPVLPASAAVLPQIGVMAGEALLGQPQAIPSPRTKLQTPASAPVPPPTREAGAVAIGGASWKPSARVQGQAQPSVFASRRQNLQSWISQSAKAEATNEGSALVPSDESRVPRTTMTGIRDGSERREARGSLSARNTKPMRRYRGRPQPLSARAALGAASELFPPRLDELPPPPAAAPAAALAAAALSRAEADVAASAVAADALHIDLHASARGAGFMQLAEGNEMKPRPPPRVGAGGALILSDAEIVERKERELDAWLRKFVRKEGLQELYHTEVTPEYEKALLHEDIGLGTASVKNVVREELGTFRVRSKNEQKLRRGVAGVGERGHALTGHKGRPGPALQKSELALEKQVELVTSTLTAGLAAEYEAAKLEGLREHHVEDIQAKQVHLKARFDEDVEVDLAKALLPPAGSQGSGSFSPGATRHALARMDDVSAKFTDALPASALQGRLQRALRSGGGPGGSSGMEAAELHSLAEDAEDSGPSRLQSPRSRPLTATDLHSGLAHLPRTPDWAPPVAGLWPRPRSRANVDVDGLTASLPPRRAATRVGPAPHTPHTPHTPLYSYGTEAPPLPQVPRQVDRLIVGSDTLHPAVESDSVITPYRCSMSRDGGSRGLRPSDGLEAMAASPDLWPTLCSGSPPRSLSPWSRAPPGML